MANDDLVAYCSPDFAKCGPAVNDLMPAAVEAFEHFTSLKWASLDPDGGNKAFHQDPVCAFWTNIPLCLGATCVPCCNFAIAARNMERISGSTCESACLKMCILNCCCIYACYYNKKRGQFRAKYGLQGAPLLDCLTACCFGPCMNCQDAEELMHAGGYNVPYCSLDAAAKAKADVSKIVKPEPKKETGAVAQVSK